MVLCLLAVDQEHRLQGSAIATSSLQLLSRPQPCFIFGAFRFGPLPILYEHLPELGQSPTNEVGRP
jgi:hypothetical protein